MKSENIKIKQFFLSVFFFFFTNWYFLFYGSLYSDWKTLCKSTPTFSLFFYIFFFHLELKRWFTWKEVFKVKSKFLYFFLYADALPNKITPIILGSKYSYSSHLLEIPIFFILHYLLQNKIDWNDSFIHYCAAIE